MNLEILEKSERKLVFLVEGVSLEMLNAIRRIIISEIPVMAIDEVIILKNDSPLYDEIVAHRLGLIPFKTDLKNYNLPRDCECGGFGCSLCQVSLTCEITNTANKPMVIYSSDLHSNDPNIIPVDPNIPIVKIEKNDKVIIEAYAVLGLSKEHVKWQAVPSCFYRFYPVIEFNASEIKGLKNKPYIVKLCPKKLFELTGDTLKLKENYWKTCNLCKACEKNSDKKIKVGWKEKSYIFSIESDGVHPFEVLLEESFKIFLEKIDEFTIKLEEIEA